MRIRNKRRGGARPTAVAVSLAALLSAGCVLGAPKMDLWPRWSEHKTESTATIDHGSWGEFLGKHVSPGPTGIHLVGYAAVTPADRALLERYLATLQGTKISDYNRDEQLAYWINLYNALTVKVILDHYPVDSIRDIDISPGWFSSGPWDAKLLEVEGEELSLNDIEHRILRPIWKDSRIHYAVNCASMGCPNLAAEPFTAENAEAMLDQAARDFVNHPRGARFDGSKLVVSNIYVWYQEDFGGSSKGVVEHLRRFAEGELAKRLADYRGGLNGQYDWDLNEPQK